MKLIQHLERKLSWRKKKQQPGLQGPSGKSDKGRKSKKVASAAMKVGDNEFSQYIRFATLLRPVPTSSVPSYEMVNIRTRPLFPTRALSPCQYQAPSPSREGALDMHIYDNIGCAAPSPDDYLPAGRRAKYGGVGPTTVTSSYRRNRIKTNPWCSSPWTNRKAFPNSTKPPFPHIENPYESIDSLDWLEAKENFTAHWHQSVNADTVQRSRLGEYSPEAGERPSLGDHRTSTYLKGRLPHHLDASYPQSAIGITEADHFLTQAPSPEFLNESLQLCSEISNYFRPSPHSSPPGSARCSGTAAAAVPSMAPYTRRVCQSQLDHFGSMETIDLTGGLTNYPEEAMSVWSLESSRTGERVQAGGDTTISSGIASCESSPKSRKATESRHAHSSSKMVKRKRPDSIYSMRQSKKVDRLKSQLKEVVHAAILEAKKEDTKKA